MRIWPRSFPTQRLRKHDLIVLASVCGRYCTLAIAVDAKAVEVLVLIKDVTTRRRSFDNWHNRVPRCVHFLSKRWILSAMHLFVVCSLVTGGLIAE